MLRHSQAPSVNPSPNANANAKSELGFKKGHEKGHETLQVGTTVGLFSVNYNTVISYNLR